MHASLGQEKEGLCGGEGYVRWVESLSCETPGGVQDSWSQKRTNGIGSCVTGPTIFQGR